MLKVTEQDLIVEAVAIITGWSEVVKATFITRNGNYSCSTVGKSKIVSGKKIRQLLGIEYHRLVQNAKIRKLVGNSKSVEFISIRNGQYFSKTGRITNGRNCTCPYQHNQRDFNFPICKHSIAASRLMRIQSFTQYMEKNAV